MGSRPIVPLHHQKQREVAGAAKQKITAPGGSNNRKALGDIGNFDTVRGVDGKLLLQINKKQFPVIGDGAVVAKRLLTKALEKNVFTVKPKPEIIEISPDKEEEEIKKEKSKPKIIEISSDKEEEEEIKKEKSKSQRSSKKKIRTLTSVLTARSRLACGIVDNSKNPNIIDIDGADVNDHLAAVEYVEDLYQFYKLAENSSRVRDYMNSQNKINGHMRMILVDWLIDGHNKFELMPETLYLTIHIVDCYLSKSLVQRKELQLLGISSMLIASKYEEIWAPEVNDFVCISDKAYNKKQILAMEKSILAKLEWTLTVPTPYVFLVRFIKASEADKEMENMVYFLAELGIMQYAMIMYRPSVLAASAVYAARCTLNKSPLWNETLMLHTGFPESQLIDCAKLLVSFHTGAAEHKLQGVQRKYSKTERCAVALLPPAKNLLA